MEKTCKCCGGRFSILNFYKNHRMRDGRLNHCKSCDDKNHAAHRRLMEKTNPKWLKRKRHQARENVKRWLLRHGIKSTGTKDAKLKWKALNPSKVKASSIANYAVKTGCLIKPKSCNRCGRIASRLEKHHEDYSKPLAIEWLCPKCHGVTKRKPIP